MATRGNTGGKGGGGRRGGMRWEDSERKERIPYPDKRFTTFFWLINTNARVYTKQQSEWLQKVLTKIVIETFSEEIGSFIDFKHPNHQFNRIYVDSNSIKVSVEVGRSSLKVHAHVIQDIAHRSLIAGSVERLKRIIEQKLKRYGIQTKAFVSVKHYPVDRFFLKQYIMKDVSEKDILNGKAMVSSYTLNP
jgi:hypothetical protein